MPANPKYIKLKANIEDIIKSETNHLFNGICSADVQKTRSFIESVIRRVSMTCLIAGYNEGTEIGKNETKNEVSKWITDDEDIKKG